MYRLLIVDDEAPIRNGLHSIIPWGQLGFAVMGAVGSGGEALEIIRRQGVDVLLTDIQMPGLSGLELAEEAKAHNPAIKVVIISGYDRFDYAVTALKLQVDDYILKPLKPGDIKSVFCGIAKRLDEERAAQNRQSHSRYVKNEYGMLRLISEELRDLEKFWRRFGSAAALRLVLVWYVDEGNGQGSAFWHRLHPMLQSHHFCVNTDTLYALFMPADNLDQALADVWQTVGQSAAAGVQVAVSQEIRQMSDIYQIFLDTTDQLSRARGGEVAWAGPGGENHSVGELKNQLVEDLEQGRSAALDATVESICREMRGRSPAHIRMVYANLLLVVARYFRLADTSGFALLSAPAPGAGDKETLDAMLLQDVHLVLGLLRQNTDSSAAVLAQRARREIERCYADAAFSLVSVADKLNVSYNYLSTLFSREEGVSLKSYLTSVRMERARQLILQREYKMYQIAGMAGYSNPRYFADAFRKYFGASPTEYAQRLGGGRDE